MNYEEFIKNYHGFSPFADNIGLKLTDERSDSHNDRRQAQPYPRGYEQR